MGFWQNVFYQQQNQKIFGKKRKKTAYISLFGITKNEEIDHLVIQAIYPFIKSPIFKIGTAAAKTTIKTAAKLHQIDLILPQLSMPVRDIVIFFDDLERASECLRISVLLGYISRYCAQRHVKCIIICNENEINNLVGEDSENENKSYLLAKEKTVRYTYRFGFDSDSIFKHLSDISKDFTGKIALKAIESKKKILLNLPKEYEASARTLITLYNLTKRFADKSGAIVHDEYYTDFIGNTTLCILAYLLELKNHDTSFNEIEEFIEKCNENVLGVPDLNRGTRQEDKQPEKSQDIYNRIKQAGFNDVVYFSSVAAHLVFHGIVPHEKKENEYKKFIKKAYQEQSIEDLLLSDYSKLTDEKFNEAVDRVYNRLKSSNDLSLSDIIHIALFFNYFLEMKLTNLYDLTTLEKETYEAIRRCSKEHPEKYTDEQEVSRLEFIYDQQAKYVGKYLTFANDEIFPINYLKTIRKDAEDVWQIICNNNAPRFLYETFGNGSKWIHQPFFSIVSHEKILDGILSMNNNVMCSFISVIDSRYKVDNNRESIVNELSNIKRILNDLEQHIESMGNPDQPLPLSLYYKKMFLDKLKELLVQYGLNDH